MSEMEKIEQTLKYEDLEKRHARPIARRVARRYAGYVEYDDVLQQIHEYIHGEGAVRIRRWLDRGEPVRVFRALNGHADSYARAEKAARVGYSVDDEFYYTPQIVEALLPLALDPSFDGSDSPDVDRAEEDRTQRGRKAPNERGDLVAQVFDVRSALDAAPPWARDILVNHKDTHDAWASSVQALIAVLGGERPWVGRRKARSNASAAVDAASGWDG